MFQRSACAAAVALAVAFGTVAASAAVPNSDEVVAVVNGKEIKRSDVVEFQQSMPQLRQVPLEMVSDQIIEHLVNSQIVIQQAYKEKLLDDPKVKQRLQQVQDQVLQQAYLQKKVEGQLTDEAIRKKYDEIVKSAPPKEEVHARHILLPNEDEAKKAISAIQGGKAFEDVAKEMSKGPSAESGGDLGYFSKDEMVPEFAAAAFAMKSGEVSKEPVKTQFGYHVIKVEDRRIGKPPAFEEVKDELKEQMGHEMILKVVEDLRAGAKIDIKKTEAAPANPAAPNKGK